ncbi:hypothetical protein [Haloglomus litoreum]|uniref:hypothetical protein n=1 Tax=Haloglomus litoreum TaxID=3034026 RepID=UPI0023E8A6C0|nr:hypothetical protein [Haloglomus sp. DT116]
MRIEVGTGSGADAHAPRPLALAAALDGVVLDATGLVAVTAAGRGPDGSDVLAGRATVVEAFRSREGVPVVGWGGPLTRVERAVLARRIEREAGAVVVLG